VLREIRDTITKALPLLAVGHVRHRGMAIPIDPFMKGTLRFASAVGTESPVWRPDNVARITSQVGSQSTSLPVDRIWKDLQLNSIILLNSLRHLVVDFDRSDPENYSLLVSDSTTQLLTADTKIYLWAFPVEVEGAATEGSTTIRVSSALHLGRGDQLEVPTDPSNSTYWKLTAKFTVTQVDLVEEDAEGFKYTLTLDNGLPRAVSSDETLFVRAFPGYFNGYLPIPTVGAARFNVVGPFLIDFLGGSLITGTRYEEFVNLKLLRADGSSLTPLSRFGDHNVQVNRMPISQDQFLFWRLLEGEMDYDGERVVCTFDANDHWRLVHRAGPHMDSPGAFAEGAVLATVPSELDNNEWFSLPDGSLTQVFEFLVDSGSYTRAAGRTTIDLTQTATSEGVAGLIIAAVANANQSDVTIDLGSLSNNDRLIANDGTTLVQFEFQVDGTYVKGRTDFVTVDVSSAVIADDAATILASLINTNVPGMSAIGVGGTTGICRVQNSGVEFASPSLQSTSTAVVAGSFQKLGLSAQRSQTNTSIVELFNNVQGEQGNVAITESIASDGFAISGMINGGGGVKWLVTLESDGDFMFLVRLHPNDDQYWELSAGITSVEVLLNPDDDP
jgi:hypothetical protein